jgi:hypothetical protein
MTATTTATRRAPLSICGLSFVDESELETIPDAKRVVVDQDGVILDGPGVVKPKAPDLALFADLCDRVDAAETAATLNAIARDTQKARRAGALTDAHVEQIAKTVTSKRALLGAPVPPASDPGPMPETMDEVSQ